MTGIGKYKPGCPGFRVAFLAAVLLAGSFTPPWASSHAQALAQSLDEGQLLEPEQAFQMEARMDAYGSLRVTWRIADDHYMYRNRFAVSSEDGAVVLGTPVFPRGEIKRDEFFGEMEVYVSDVSFSIPVTPLADGLTEFSIKAVGQGCNEAIGVCFPPVTEIAPVRMEAFRSTVPQSKMDTGGTASDTVDSLKGLLTGGSGQPTFLHPDDAFKFELTPMGPEALLARFHIEPGYYLYKDKFSVSSGNSAVHVSRIELPQGKRKTDEYFGDIVVFYDGFDAQILLDRDDAELRNASFKVGYQGCAEDGICYPPIEKSVTLRLPGVSDAFAAESGFDSPASGFFESSLWPVLLAFGSGLLLTFTPCVLPMVPILAGIIVGQGDSVDRVRGGGLASVYVLGTAVTYAAVGVVAGLTGDQLQAYFQNVWAIGFVCVLLVLMALSMFGLFELRMPSALQSRLQHRATGLKAGAFSGVFLMGILSALIVGACVSPVLISILSLAINRGDPLLGGAIMFSMALGMGLFLIAMGFGFGHLLPRTGPWMVTVNHAFGILLLAVVIYLLGALPNVPVLYLWSALFIGTAVYLGRPGVLKEPGVWLRTRWGIAILLLVWGVLAGLGGTQGNRDVLKPVNLTALSGSAGARTVEHARFRRVADLEELEQLMQTADVQGKPVMVDYYADWCVDCVRMENTTLASPEVARLLNDEFLLVQVDVTDPNNPGTSAIKQHHGIFGPPAMLFFDDGGQEIKSMRRYGYMDSEEFLEHIKPLIKP